MRERPPRRLGSGNLAAGPRRVNKCASTRSTLDTACSCDRGSTRVVGTSCPILLQPTTNETYAAHRRSGG